jgi:hypothetical protein
MDSESRTGLFTTSRSWRIMARSDEPPGAIRRVVDCRMGSFVGMISKADMQFLFDQLEEESESDTDYFVDSNSIDALE